MWQNLNADGIQNLLLHSQMLLDNRNNAYLAAGTLFQMAVCKVNSDVAITNIDALKLGIGRVQKRQDPGAVSIVLNLLRGNELICGVNINISITTIDVLILGVERAWTGTHVLWRPR